MKVLFLDLETSGFDPHQGEILECYAQSYDVADATGGSIFTATINWPDSVLEKIWSQHSLNGLKEDCQNSTFHWVNFAPAFQRFLSNEFGPTASVRLAGFSPQFDYRWLTAKTRLGPNRLSHRLFDISTIRDWLSAMSYRDCLPDSTKAAMRHRAKEDVEVAIKTLEMARATIYEG